MLTTETLPAALPTEFGENCTLKLLDCPALNEIGNVAPEILYPLPVTFNAEIVNVEVPLLVI